MKDRKYHRQPHENDTFTLDQPVTRQIISVETGLSYITVCRRLRKMEFVEDRSYIGPRIYAQILEKWGFL